MFFFRVHQGNVVHHHCNVTGDFLPFGQQRLACVPFGVDLGRQSRHPIDVCRVPALQLLDRVVMGLKIVAFAPDANVVAFVDAGDDGSKRDQRWFWCFEGGERVQEKVQRGWLMLFFDCFDLKTTIMLVLGGGWLWWCVPGLGGGRGLVIRWSVGHEEIEV